MKRMKAAVVLLGLAGLFPALPGCGRSERAQPRIDHELTKTTDPKQQQRLLQQAQQRFGGKEGKP
jgi:hypothetical protein